MQTETGFFQRPFEEVWTEYLGEKSKSSNQHTYNPQGVTDMEKPKIKIETGVSDVYSGVLPKTHKQTKTGYPKSLLEIKGVTVDKNRLHPTQKPVELLEYLIKTYSNEGETVLDNCMGSGSTGVACKNTNRNFIGIELDEKYFNIACNRLEERQCVC